MATNPATTGMSAADLIATIKAANEALKEIMGAASAKASVTQSKGAAHAKEVTEKSGVEGAIHEFADMVDVDLLKDASVITSPTSENCGKQGTSVTLFALKGTGEVTYRLTANW